MIAPAQVRDDFTDAASPTRRSTVPGAEDGLGLQVFLEAFDAVFAAVARPLVAAEGGMGVQAG
jgi:hypothetical protein